MTSHYPNLARRVHDLLHQHHPRCRWHVDAGPCDEGHIHFEVFRHLGDDELDWMALMDPYDVQDNNPGWVATTAERVFAACTQRLVADLN